MTFTEKMNIAIDVLINEDVTTYDEQKLDSKIIQKYSEIDADGFNEMQLASVSEEKIIEQAYNFFAGSLESNTDNEIGNLNTDPYTSPNNINSNKLESENIPKEIISNSDGKGKKTHTVEDITKKKAMSLPEKARDLIAEYVNSDFNEQMKNANSTEVNKFLINTPVRQYLINRTFTVSPDAAKKFLEKYENLVWDDNTYDPNNPEKIEVEGDNVKAFKEIKSLLLSGGLFDVNTPSSSSQKVIGVQLVTHTDGQDIPLVIKTQDIALKLISEYAGRIPGDPGIQVLGINQSTENSDKSDKTKIISKVSYVGKAKALQDDEVNGKLVESKYVEHTSIPLGDEDAINKYGTARNTITVKSKLKFKIREKKDSNKEVTTRTVRVSGKLEVPYFIRKEEYVAQFGEPESRKYVKELTLSDKNDYITLAQAFAADNPNVIASNWNLSDLLTAIDESKIEPPDVILPDTREA